MRREFSYGGRAVGRSDVELDAHDPHTGKAVRQRKRAPAKGAAGLEDPPRAQRPDYRIEEEHFAQENTAATLLLRDRFDRGTELRQKPVRICENSSDAGRSGSIRSSAHVGSVPFRADGCS